MQEWFKKAKLGVFIHWGIYAVDGIPESWSFGSGDISYEEYMKQLDGFTAAKYDPNEWAELFVKAGAKYAVLTTKHHDGVALFDTKASDLNVVKRTPAARDLIKPYCEAMRDHGLKVGLYFTNTDWSDTDHLEIITGKSSEEIDEMRKKPVVYSKLWAEEIEAADKRYKEDPDKAVDPDKLVKWERFMKLYKTQIAELMSNYGTVDLMWFDVMLQVAGYDWDSRSVKEYLLKKNPDIVVNSRLGDYGDYETPECYIPLKPLDKPWELCTTFSDAWGYRKETKNIKSTRQIVRMFVECISKGGNMLISLGPDAEGAIPPEIKDSMLKLGEWIKRYEEAIYPTCQGIGTDYFCGGSTLSEDRKTLYLFCYDIQGDKIMLNGIRNHGLKITALKTGKQLSYKVIGGAWWINMPGCIWIDIDKGSMDDVCTVIKIEFGEPIDLVEMDRKVDSKGEM